MFQNVYNILTLFLGESKQGGYSKDIEQYQFDCCSCAEENGGIVDNKHNLEILLSPTRGLKYHCWKCGETHNMRGNIGTLIKKYGNTQLYNDYKNEIISFKNSRLYDINLFEGNALAEFDETLIKLPSSFTKIILSENPNKRLVHYLNERGISQEIIDRYNIGYTTWDDKDWALRNKIIIPSYDSFGDINYFVGRDFTGKSKIKYRNCDADKQAIIFQESLINWDSTVFLVEGAIDCLMLPNSIAMLGKYLSRNSNLYSTLLKKCNGDIVICLDGDTDINETKRIYNMLNFNRLRNKIWYIRLGCEEVPQKDFNEIYVSEGKKGIINAIKTMKQFDEIDLIF